MHMYIFEFFLALTKSPYLSFTLSLSFLSVSHPRHIRWNVCNMCVKYRYHIRCIASSICYIYPMYRLCRPMDMQSTVRLRILQVYVQVLVCILYFHICTFHYMYPCTCILYEDWDFQLGCLLRSFSLPLTKIMFNFSFSVCIYRPLTFWACTNACAEY